MSHILPTRRPGDVFLYSSRSAIAWFIRVKTWSRYSHVEVSDGVTSVASRDGIGVGRYPFRRDQLALMLRPREAYNVEAARAWFETVDGQGYDFLGLLSFYLARRTGADNGRMFCSEFATRMLRAGGIDPFNRYDADGIAPSEFVKSVALRVIWRENGDGA